MDNGSTYRGDTLRVACGRLGITLLHARPYDPQARGKMERFWRTLREQCLCFIAQDATLHDVNVRLWAWLGQHYHTAPHAGLMGRCPNAAWAPANDRPIDPIDEQRLRDAMTVRERRRVRRDTTLTVEGNEFELDQGFLAGQLITVAWCPLDEPPRPWAELHGKTYPLHLVDRIANAHRKRPLRRPDEPSSALPHSDFDPNRPLLERAVGRDPSRTKGES